ncbi:hypothetical protein B5P45_01635 [Phyllobacterium zundukense]|uniref:Uncharacterized protein n=1 Tax=Phyllobacterium zundukense TaxID=1867719 RepID=A0A2N9W460_9HYPH|nr:hypothetical protein BLM14_10445 [Phyllobacterium zundukense]PIO46528.1 hypothetical protein B5P45_01635 [Phyllobacterium zundukense]
MMCGEPDIKFAVNGKELTPEEFSRLPKSENILGSIRKMNRAYMASLTPANLKAPAVLSMITPWPAKD